MSQASRLADRNREIVRMFVETDVPKRDISKLFDLQLATVEKIIRESGVGSVRNDRYFSEIAERREKSYRLFLAGFNIIEIAEKNETSESVARADLSKKGIHGEPGNYLIFEVLCELCKSGYFSLERVAEKCETNAAFVSHILGRAVRLCILSDDYRIGCDPSDEAALDLGGE